MLLKKRLVTYKNTTIMKRGMNLSSLFFMVMLSITLNFFRTRSDIIGKMKVVANTTARQMSALKYETSNIPDTVKIRIIHVGNNTG